MHFDSNFIATARKIIIDQLEAMSTGDDKYVFDESKRKGMFYITIKKVGEEPGKETMVMAGNDLYLMYITIMKEGVNLFIKNINEKSSTSKT